MMLAATVDQTKDLAELVAESIQAVRPSHLAEPELAALGK
jgi:hypothetical protein